MGLQLVVKQKSSTHWWKRIYLRKHWHVFGKHQVIETTGLSPIWLVHLYSHNMHCWLRAEPPNLGCALHSLRDHTMSIVEARPSLFQCDWFGVQPENQKGLRLPQWLEMSQGSKDIWAYTQASSQELWKRGTQHGKSFTPHKMLTVPYSLLVLHVLSPVHCGLCWSWCHRHCPGE